MLVKCPLDCLLVGVARPTASLVLVLPEAQQGFLFTWTREAGRCFALFLCHLGRHTRIAS